MEVGDITRLLQATSGETREGVDRAFAAVYPQLREIARARKRGWRAGEALGTTGLVHEAYLKLAGTGSGRYQDRAHFFATAAKAMRQVLMNFAEKQAAQKRGGGAAPVTLHDDDALAREESDELVSLNEALARLEELNERQARVVECLFLLGLTIAETAETLGTSPATVKRDWTAARAWLYREMRV